MDRRQRYIFWIVGSLTLGLAPFTPQPHLFEKLGMLFSGQLGRPIDMFDLCLHGLFPALLAGELIAHLRSAAAR
jgi:hypothetical protein